MGGRGGGSGMGSKDLMARFGTADTPSGITVDDFRKLDDDDLARFMASVQSATVGADMPEFLNGWSHTQRLVYALGMNDMPTVVSDADFQKLVKAGATPIYRSVDDFTYSWHRNNNTAATYGDSISADDQLDMIAYGDQTFVGNGMFGDGLYFTNVYSNSRRYGTDATMKSVINPITIRAVTFENLKKEYDAYMSQHKYRVRKSFKDAARQSTRGNSYAQFAILRGYNAIVEHDTFGQRGMDYYNILDRSALIVSDTYEH